MSVRLDDEEKGILRYLGRGYSESLDLNDITNHLNDLGYSKVSKKEVLDKLGNLMDYGYVRSKAEEKGPVKNYRFYLARGIGGGGRRSKSLQGRGLIHDTSSLIKRLFGSVFLLFGLGVLIVSGSGTTGAVISSGDGFTVTFVLSFALAVIGVFLLRKSFRK